MPRLTCSRDGWGTVRDHETGDRVAIDDEVDQDVADRLAAQYDPIEVEDSPDSSEDDDEADDGEKGETICGAEMSDGTVCTRDPEECSYHD